MQIFWEKKKSSHIPWKHIEFEQKKCTPDWNGAKRPPVADGAQAEPWKAGLKAACGAKLKSNLLRLVFFGDKIFLLWNIR